MAERTRVSIVGGGVAGLALAAALDPGRFAVRVLEAEPERAASGGALTIWPAAARALRRLGAGELVARHTHPVDGGTVRDLRTGRALLPSASARLTIVPRPDLLAALEARVPDSVVREQVAVDDPGVFDADLVVGADGVRSRVRELVRGRGGDRSPTPYLALRGFSDRPPGAGTVGEYWGGGRLLGVVPVGAGIYWFTTHRSALGPEPIDPGEALGEVREVFADVAAPAGALLAQAHADRVVATRIWVAPPMTRYVRGRYVVIGDAAHAMTPNLGRGANDAILDAVTLARAIGSRGGLARWQARRLPFTQGARVASGAVMRVALGGLPPGRRG